MSTAVLSGWTLVFLFDTQYRVLMIRRSATKKLLPGVVNGIGGRIDPHDESPQAAARREVFEETGLTVGELALHGTMVVQRSTSDGSPTERAVIYLFTAHDFTGQLRPDCPEGELFWCPLTDIPQHTFTREFDLYWPHLLGPRKVFHVWTEYHDGQPGTLLLM